MSMLADAFNMAYGIVAKQVNIVRVGVATIPIKVAPTAFEATGDAPSEVIIEGRQFLVSSDLLNRALAAAGAPGAAFKKLKRGDRIESLPDYGPYTIDKIDELPGLAGEVVGYRVTTN